MKYQKFIFVAFLSLISFAVQSDFSHYVGADINTTFHKCRGNSTKTSPSLNIFSGLKFPNRLMIEAGAYHSSRFTAGRTYITKRSIYASFLADLPLTNQLSFKFGAGVSQYMPRIYSKGYPKKTHYGLIPRFCGGIGYQLSDGLEGRAGLIWEKTSILEKSHPHLKHDNFHINVGVSKRM
jgi:hypothetical protein